MIRQDLLQGHGPLPAISRQPFERKGVSRFEVTVCDFKRGGPQVGMPLKVENVAGLLHWIRGEKVLLDADLGRLYGVSTKALNQAVGRNRTRFPADFMFQLSRKEWEDRRSQIVTASGPDTRSQFVTASRNIGAIQLRRLMDSNRPLARKIEAMEKRYDEQFAVVFEAIKRLIAEDDARKAQPKHRIGFTS